MNPYDPHVQIILTLVLVGIPTLGFTVMFLIAWRYMLQGLLFVTGTMAVMGWVVLFGVLRGIPL